MKNCVNNKKGGEFLCARELIQMAVVRKQLLEEFERGFDAFQRLGTHHDGGDGKLIDQEGIGGVVGRQPEAEGPVDGDGVDDLFPEVVFDLGPGAGSGVGPERLESVVHESEYLEDPGLGGRATQVQVYIQTTDAVIVLLSDLSIES